MSCVVLNYEEFLSETSSEVQTVRIIQIHLDRILNIPSQLVSHGLRFPPEDIVLFDIALEVLRTIASGNDFGLLLTKDLNLVVQDLVVCNFGNIQLFLRLAQDVAGILN